MAIQGKEKDQYSMYEASIETTMAYIELKKLQTGEICTYETLRAVMNCDPQSDGYSYVMTARKRIERELDCVLEPVANIGIKRLVPREVIKKGGRDLAHVRRSVRRGIKRQVTIVPLEKYNELTPEEQRAFNLQLSCMGALDLATAPKTTKRIEQAMNTEWQRIPAGEVLTIAAALKTSKSNPKAGDIECIASK